MRNKIKFVVSRNAITRYSSYFASIQTFCRKFGKGKKIIRKISSLIIFVLLILPLISLDICSPKVFAKEEIYDYYIVKYSEAKTAEEIANIYNISVDKVEKLPEFDAFRIELTQAKNNVGGYSPDSNFYQNLEYYEPDFKFRVPVQPNNEGDNSSEGDVDGQVIPNDPYYSSQWGLTKIEADDAWQSTTGSSSVTIAIVDTGIDGTHEDLSGKVIAGYDYVNETSIAANSDSDDYGHGTTVAGVASAITNNSIGIAGTDWNARLMPVKVLDSSGTGWSSDVAYGIRYAVDNGADVINMSLGSSDSSSLISSAIDYAYSAGVAMVAASGNGNAAQRKRCANFISSEIRKSFGSGSNQ